MASRLMTVTEAAEVLDLWPSAVRHAVQTGLLKAEKIGPMWLIRDTEVERYKLDRPKPGPKPAPGSKKRRGVKPSRGEA